MMRNTPATGIFRSVFELFGIVLVRFRPVPRMWAAWLVLVNTACLLFLQHVEAQVTLGAVGVAVIAQALIYSRRGFIRLLGTTHVVWVPMLAWMAVRLDSLQWQEGAFRAWVLTLMVTNGISLVIDAWDASRFIRGERRPYYAW
jgi:hypothetical protein